jgi:hypothetical protein
MMAGHVDGVYGQVRVSRTCGIQTQPRKEQAGQVVDASRASGDFVRLGLFFCHVSGLRWLAF